MSRSRLTIHFASLYFPARFSQIYDSISTIRLAVREAYERRRAARLSGEEEIVERARRNISKAAVAVAEGKMKRVVVKSEERAEGEEDGTRRWMEST